MAEYIDREALMSQIRLTASRSSVGETSLNDISVKTICGLILEAPTADVVEVVRCKDCEHFKAYSDPLKGFYGECMVRESDIGENDFCSYGIRKEGAEE